MSKHPFGEGARDRRARGDFSNNVALISCFSNDSRKAHLLRGGEREMINFAGGIRGPMN